MVTDPPYGVQYDSSWRYKAGISTKDGAFGKSANDDQNDWQAAYALFPGRIAYAWMSSLALPVAARGLDAFGFVRRSLIIWDKGHIVISRGHVAVLDGGLRERGYHTLLLHGEPDSEEGSLAHLMSEQGLPATQVAGLGRRVSPWRDLKAFGAVARAIFETGPDVVHTHTAKAGILGRLAAILYNVTRRRSKRCLVVHTYHGNVFRGYFGRIASWLVRGVERTIGLGTDRDRRGIGAATLRDRRGHTRRPGGQGQGRAAGARPRAAAAGRRGRWGESFGPRRVAAV